MQLSVIWYLLVYILSSPVKICLNLCSELLIHRGPNCPSLSVFEHSTPYWNALCLPFSPLPGWLLLPQESSLIRVPLWPCFCPCCCKCLKCLSFSQIHPDTPVNASTSNMVPSESISWSCYEHSEKAVAVFAVAFTPVVIILWLSSASHIDWVPWERNPSYSTLWPPQS